MEPVSFSSGDLIADRRADYAEMLAETGDHGAAAALMRDALELAPAWTAGWFRLGEWREAAGDGEGAADAWRECLRLEPADRLGAVLKLRLAGRAEAIDAPPSAFVETLFDQYAGEFDAALVARLEYRVPELMAAALGALGREQFGRVIDLGCGTGLMGERLRTGASLLEGIDISAGMLRKAKAKRIYDRLHQDDLQQWEEARGSADLIVAADVFMYVGALERIVAAGARALRPGGVFAFSVESHDGPDAMVLRESRRFAHSRSYITALLAEAGLEVLSIDRAAIRMDRGEPVEGMIVVAMRPAWLERTPIARTDDEQPLGAAFVPV